MKNYNKKFIMDIPLCDLKLQHITEETERGTNKFFAVTKYPVNDIWWNINQGWQMIENTEGKYDRAGDIKDGTKSRAITWLKMQFAEHPGFMADKLGSLEGDLVDLLNKHYNMMGDYSFKEIRTAAQTPTSTGDTSASAGATSASVNLDMTETNELLRKIADSNKDRSDFDKATIEAITNKLLESKTEEISQSIFERAEEAIKKRYGELPEVKDFQLPDGTRKMVTGTFHHEMENIMRFVQLNIPVMLTGPAGAGKNFTLEKAAEILGMNFYFTNAVTQEFQLKGFIDGNGVYQETQFYKAMKDGGLFMLDEMDASIPEALIILNSAIANGYFDFPIGRVTAHPDFRVVAAANTYGTGTDMVYVGRNVLDGATLDRFAVIPFGYDENVERNLCPDQDLYEFCTAMRKAINDRQLRYIISPRAMINSYKLSKDIDLSTKTPRFTKEYIIKVAIVKGMTKDDLVEIRDDIPDSEWKTALRSLINEI